MFLQSYYFTINDHQLIVYEYNKNKKHFDQLLKYSVFVYHIFNYISTQQFVHSLAG